MRQQLGVAMHLFLLPCLSAAYFVERPSNAGARCSDDSSNSIPCATGVQPPSKAGKQIQISNRRQLLNAFGAAAVVSSNMFGNLNTASAAVFVDPDRYGDKELKSATVNKLRQTVRDELIKDPKLAPCLLRIAIQDALTFNAATEEGGPDGRIVSAILAKDAPSSISDLKPAAEKLLQMYAKVKRTTETTMADLVQFAGAEAIETFGGPRTVVQLGKLDAAKDAKKTTYPNIFGTNASTNDVVDSFAQAKLNERDIALLFGALGAMEQVLNAYQEEEVEEEEENEMGDKQIYIPSSFGSPKEIYGKNIGVMDNSVFVNAMSDIKGKKQPSYNVFGDAEVAKWVAKYADKKGGFLKDLPFAYGRLTALGTTYTGGKIANLLGTTDD